MFRKSVAGACLLVISVIDFVFDVFAARFCHTFLSLVISGELHDLAVEHPKCAVAQIIGVSGGYVN